MPPTARDGLLRAAAGPAPGSPPDGELLARYADHGDEAAFHALVRRHAGMVLGTCRRVLGNAADADDAFQATFVVLVRKARALAGRLSVGAFLHGVAFHTALKLRATTVKRRAKEARAARPGPPPDRSDLLAALDEELARLPEKYRAAVVLCELEGRSRREAAAALGVPQGTLSSRLAAAHRTLEARLRARGFTGVGVGAVLAAWASVGTDALAAAAVRAALGPTAGVSQLATEVTKMLFLRKLGLGAAVTAALLAVAAAVSGPGAPGTPPRAAAATQIPPATEPAWMKNFRAAYQLREGEYVKRVPPPFVPERADFVRVRFPGADARSFAGLLAMGVLFAEADGKAVVYRAVVSTDAVDFDRPTVQVRPKRLPLRTVIAMTTGRLPPEVVFDERAKDQDVFVDCDFVVRTAAPLDKLLPDLQAALARCGTATPATPPALALREEEQDVYVVSGRFKVTPRPWRPGGEVDVYADEAVLSKGFTDTNPQPDEWVNTGMVTGSPVEFVRELGAFVNRRMVWEAEAPGHAPVRAYTHVRRGGPAADQARDRDPERVLRNVSEQTGLVFERVRRKVSVLVVTVPRPGP